MQLILENVTIDLPKLLHCQQPYFMIRGFGKHAHYFVKKRQVAHSQYLDGKRCDRHYPGRLWSDGE